MAAALVTLAVLQYHWLGSISNAEKKRLEENLEASSTNFVADLNRNFLQLRQVFKIQITPDEREIRDILGDSYLTWISTSRYPNLVDSVFYIKNISTSEVEVKLFETDPIRLRDIRMLGHVADWISRQREPGKSPAGKVDVMQFPMLGDPSLISVPVQLFDLVTMENPNAGSNLQVSLNIDQADHVVLLQLNDDVIKEEMIPDIAKSYFSESYDDQYHISILQNIADGQNIYMTSSKAEIPEPDIKKSLQAKDVSSVFLLSTNWSSNKSSSGSDFFDRLDSSKTSIKSIRIHDKNSQRFESMVHGYTTVKTESLANFNERIVVESDTTIDISTSFLAAAFNIPDWEFWLSFKEGSLDQIVNKTKNRNLAISFGILLILGFSVGMVVLFSQRSRDLAEKQMLFVAGVSHELRTPLTVIRSAAENLKEGLVQDEGRKNEYASLMLKEGRRLSEMVDQIMEFSGIQSGKKVYQFSKFEIQELINELSEEYRIHLEEQGMALELSTNIQHKEMYADRDALFLALSNLIQNAIKFSNGSPLISLKADIVEYKSGAAAQFEIKDNGIGIPEEERAHIFEPFFRGKHSVEEQVKGNGIGLSLVQKVVEAHKGEIKVKSEERRGSSFLLTIPIGEGSGNG